MAEETVVLVHGLWMNGLDMSLLAARTRRKGYKTAQFSYNSVGKSPRENAGLLQQYIQELESPVIHFIGHSLGGLVIRHLFHDYPAQRPGRVVTLGTPHKGSYSASRLEHQIVGRWMLGNSVDSGLLGDVPAWDGSRDLGSIAGNLRFGLGIIIPGVPVPNDGTVAVEETRLDNMSDHITVSASHFGLLLSSRAASLSLEFLREGDFSSI